MKKNKVIVNSWNEWDPLKHVIVGRADGTCIPAPEPALDAKVPEDSDMRGQFGPRTKDTVDKANQLICFINRVFSSGTKLSSHIRIFWNFCIKSRFRCRNTSSICSADNHMFKWIPFIPTIYDNFIFFHFTLL